MAKENTGLDCKLKRIDEARNLLGEKEHNDLMSKKDKKTCRNLGYFDHSLLFISAVSGCVSIYAFASLNAIPIGITNSAVGLKICVITAEV